MAGRGTDIVLGGNAPGLARLYLERLLLPKLSKGTAEADEATEDNPMALVVMRTKTEGVVQATLDSRPLTLSP